MFDFANNSENIKHINEVISNIAGAIFYKALDEKIFEIEKSNIIPDEIVDSIFISVENEESNICDLKNFGLEQLVIDYIHKQFVKLGIVKYIRNLVKISVETPVRLAKSGYYEKEHISNDVFEKVANEVVDEQIFDEYC